ncbi:antibiotic biosynthesis monooxygenase [Hahella sp. KA22]|uniref:putative quinol monooxygenase n=1 Tax=Hahella sp. KA22 TaxID=1628392 RepID=UPI000FDCE50A|nr:antibiotic biosynthesis monooxygenase [Hahella sp. KA22]AZZ92318.1 antibiotic biosynthesis monooxygenase [Hahella sp. KA22]QAY55690.1 antibiotic biosynthesis monooxygenase [Hahella sp. KA22]
MSKVILKGYIIVPHEDLSVVEQALSTHIQLTLAEAGCLVFQVTQHDRDPNRFDVYEEFVDRAAFNAHQARVKNSHWGGVTLNVARHYEICEE